MKNKVKYDLRNDFRVTVRNNDARSRASAATATAAAAVAAGDLHYALVYY